MSNEVACEKCNIIKHRDRMYWTHIIDGYLCKPCLEKLEKLIEAWLENRDIFIKFPDI